MDQRSKVILPVVAEHAQEVACLWGSRQFSITAPHVDLYQLARHDNRIAAHFDGLRVAGGHGVACCGTALEQGAGGEVFAASVLALEQKSGTLLSQLLEMAATSPQFEGGMISAVGWVSSSHLQGLAKEWLRSSASYCRRLGIAACAQHRVDPGSALTKAVSDRDDSLRKIGLVSVGDLGRTDLLENVVSHLNDTDSHTCSLAISAAIMLGDRGQSISIASQVGPVALSWQALSLLLKVMPLAAAHELLAVLAQPGEKNPAIKRRLIRGCGMIGDTRYVPWLIGLMSEDAYARSAGEAFSMITGLDLWQPPFFRPQPDVFESGPSEDPNDENVAMDEDEGLPWPHQESALQWWRQNQPRFSAGIRTLMGQPVTREHCINVLRNGYQRQRMAAAQYLCLLQPGTPLFNTAAPAWRQQRWLAQGGA